jgi:hypothetical protein
MNMLDAGAGMLLAALLAVPSLQDPVASGNKPTVVVGTFDSRAVLVAYVGSKSFQGYLDAQKADIERARERAKDAGDNRLAADLDKLGPAMQLRIHQQGFSTAPVDDIIARIQARLPGIANRAGVDVIVSKWALTYQGPSARFVDVTDLLVAEFDPSAATLQSIRGLLRQDPVPLDQIEELKEPK